MSEQITLLVTGTAKPERFEELKRRLTELAKLTRSESGNICYELHEIDGKTGEFFLYENWKDQTALDLHMKKDYLQQFFKDCEVLLQEKLKAKRASIIK